MSWGVKLVMQKWRSSCHPTFHEPIESQPHDHLLYVEPPLPSYMCTLQCTPQCATHWLIVKVYKEVWFCLPGTISEILCHDSKDFSYVLAVL